MFATVRKRASCPLQSGFKLGARFTRRHPARRFVANYAKTVAAFGAQTMNQAARFFVGHAARFAAALTDYRPAFLF